MMVIMNRGSTYVCLVVLSGLLAVGQGIAQDIHFEKVERPKGDFNRGISNIVQDKKGFLWLASEAGLYNYDGHEFIKYWHDPNDSNTPADFTIWGVIVDHDGIIWISPGGYGLDRLDPETGIFTHYRHDDRIPTSLSDDQVTAIYEDRDHALWIGTESGLDKFDPLENVFTHYSHKASNPTSLSCNEVREIFEDREGTLWVGTGNEYMPPMKDHPGGLNRFDKKKGTFERFEHKENDPTSLVDNRVTVIFEDSRGTFWVGTVGDGLHTMDRKTGKFQRHSFDPEHPTRLSRPPVNNRLSYVPDNIKFILEDTKGRIWIGAFEGAISVYDPVSKTCRFYDVHDDGKGNLNGTGFWTGFKSADNTIWLTTAEFELYKVTPPTTQLPHVNLGNSVFCFLEDQEHNYWMGTDNGIVKQTIDGKNQSVNFNDFNDKEANFIASLKFHGETIWAASQHGLHSVNTNTMRFETIRHSPSNNESIVSDQINVLEIAGGDQLWIGTQNGLDLMDTKTRVVKHYSNFQGDTTSLTYNRILSLLLDRNKSSWVGTFHGLNRFDSVKQNFKHYLKRLAILSLYQDHSGQLWCGTDAGLFQYDAANDQFEKFADKSTLISPSLVVGSICEDAQDNLWMASPQKGVIRLNNNRDHAVAYGENQGVNKEVLYSPAFLTSTREVLIGDASGYFVIRPNELEKNVLIPTVYIDNFLLNDVPIKPGTSDILPESLTTLKAIHLSHDQNTFSFEFTDIDFVSKPEDSRLLFELHNYDNSWRRADEERAAHYFNLLPGEYVFRVKAINADGVSAQKEVAVVIHPPWWKTWWAYSLLALSIGSIILTLYRNRINQFKEKQAEQMSLMVATQEGERKRISQDLHDDVGTKLSALKLSLSSLVEKADRSEDREVKILAQNSEHFITEVMHDVRQLLMNLSPAVLEEFGYTTAVESLISRLNETRKIKFDLIIFGWKSVRKDYELALYRITQELINNVIRHAEAKNVSLQVGRRDDKIILMIEDDGKGFDVLAQPGGYGLHNLQARTKVMKGSMSIDSRPGCGTSILIEIPYPT